MGYLGKINVETEDNRILSEITISLIPTLASESNKAKGLFQKKYFIRASNRAALIITLDNIDWGAADSFVRSNVTTNKKPAEQSFDHSAGILITSHYFVNHYHS